MQPLPAQQQEERARVELFVKTVVDVDISYIQCSISSLILKKVVDAYLKHIKLDEMKGSHQEGNNRRNWKKEWNGYSQILRHLCVEEMKNALGEKNEIITTRDKENLKNRFKKKFPMSHPLVQYLLRKNAICYLMKMRFISVDFNMNRLDDAKNLLFLKL